MGFIVSFNWGLFMPQYSSPDDDPFEGDLVDHDLVMNSTVWAHSCAPYLRNQ